MSRFIRCYAHEHEGQWQAICLDFDLMAEGKSLSEVQDQLNWAIRSYVEDAMAEEEPSKSALLHRKSPVHVRLAWLLPFFFSSLFDRKHDGDSTVQFPVSCHA